MIYATNRPNRCAIASLRLYRHLGLSTISIQFRQRMHIDETTLMTFARFSSILLLQCHPSIHQSHINSPRVFRHFRSVRWNHDSLCHSPGDLYPASICSTLKCLRYNYTLCRYDNVLGLSGFET